MQLVKGMFCIGPESRQKNVCEPRLSKIFTR